MRLPASWRVAALVGALCGAGADSASPLERSLVLIPAQDRAGDPAAAAALEQSLHDGLGRLGRLVGASPTRDALRRLRLRNGDRTPPALLSRLARELGADWLVSVTLHDAQRQDVPTVAVSARVYSGSSGELTWAGFEAGSGLDGRTVLGLGGTSDLDELVRRVAGRLLDRVAEPDPAGAPGRPLGVVALVPLSASTELRATPVADAVTEAVRAELVRDGVSGVSANVCAEILRRHQEGRWGSVASPTREALHRLAGADTILTGEVEEYTTRDSQTGPAPHVAIALRLLDARSGRIVWTDWLERDESRSLRPFGLGRPHAPGVLTSEMVETMIGRLDPRGSPQHDEAEPR